MSGIVLIKGTDAVHVVSDFAAYDSATGIVRGFVPKSFGITHLRAAVAVRADRAAVLNEISTLAGLATYSDLKPAAMRIAAKVAHMSRAEIYVCGFDEHDNADAFVVSTGDVKGAAMISALPIEGFAVTPMEPATYAELADLDGIAPDDIAPVRDGRRIITAMRRHPIGSIYGIGGMASLITVTRERITSEIICRWPDDRIGEPINPLAEATAA